VQERDQRDGQRNEETKEEPGNYHVEEDQGHDMYMQRFVTFLGDQIEPGTKLTSDVSQSCIKKKTQKSPSVL
jgi:hypothetical protein